jgi:hypothetical protein
MRRRDDDFPHDQDESDGDPSKHTRLTELVHEIIDKTAFCTLDRRWH